MNINEILRKNLTELTADEQKIIVSELCRRFTIELAKQDKSGIYRLTQYTMAYHSNKMEGSTLTEDQTRCLFDDGILPASQDEYKVKDIEEAQGHFRMFHEVVHTYSEPLTQEQIKNYHFRLKQGVFEDWEKGYVCGEYKSRTNAVSDIVTARPEEVEEQIELLLEWYQSQRVSIDVLAEFHARYEMIHPHQDGNGRIGRMIMFKECLCNGIIPVMITKERESVYKKELNHAQKNGDYSSLADVFRASQQGYYTDIAIYLTEMKRPKKH